MPIIAYDCLKYRLPYKVRYRAGGAYDNLDTYSDR